MDAEGRRKSEFGLRIGTRENYMTALIGAAHLALLDGQLVIFHNSTMELYNAISMSESS